MKPLTFILAALVIFNTAVPIASEDTANPNDFVPENIDLYTSILPGVQCIFSPGDRSPEVNRCILAAIYPPISKTENEQYDCKTSSEILPFFDGEKVFDFVDYFPITCDKGTTCADISKSALRLILKQARSHSPEADMMALNYWDRIKVLLTREYAAENESPVVSRDFGEQWRYFIEMD